MSRNMHVENDPFKQLWNMIHHLRKETVHMGMPKQIYQRFPLLSIHIVCT
jgi:hypothetical protein